MITTKRNVTLTSIKHEFHELKDCWYLADYMPHADDSISQSIISYKQAQRPITDKWNNLAMIYIKQLNIQPDYILRSLGSREMLSLVNRPLDNLCYRAATHFQATYNPFLLMKKRHTKPLHTLAKTARQKELEDIYVFNLLAPQPEPLTILVIDDIITTGTTMRAIHSAIRKNFPTAETYAFALAKTVAKSR